VQWYDPGAPEVPHAGRYHGREDVSRFFAVIGETLEFENFEPREFVADRDLVIVLGALRARVNATGRFYDNEWAMVWRLRDGKVASWQVYEDTARELAAHAG
jgi:ketosteroid isomerase-like protein